MGRDRVGSDTKEQKKRGLSSAGTLLGTKRIKVVSAVGEDPNTQHFIFNCCTETVGTIWDGESRTPTSTSTQLLSSETVSN